MTVADRLRAVVAPLPEGAAVMLPIAVLRQWLADDAPAGPISTNGTTWRERLWTCPPETRLGVRELSEAVGRPKSWVYRAVAAKRGSRRLPANRLDGELVFEAGAVRQWIGREQTEA